MANRMYPAATIRLRISEASYEAIRSVLPKAEGGYILAGLCGWTQRKGTRGIESVLCVHTVGDTVLPLNATGCNTLMAWIEGQNGIEAHGRSSSTALKRRIMSTGICNNTSQISLNTS